jgi:cytidylate kinase
MRVGAAFAVLTAVPSNSPDGALPLVVTISRQLASGGAYIGQRVAQRLGMRYVDREILSRAAAILGLEDERTIENLEEHASDLWSRMRRAIAIGAPDAKFVPPPPPAVDEGIVQDAQTQFIREIAARDEAVIVGRGAPHVLGGRDNVIRVFIHAPKRTRIAEVGRIYQLSQEDARAMVERSDRDRARFVQSLTGRSWTDACLYDLTVDTSVFAPDLVVDLLVHAVNARRR